MYNIVEPERQWKASAPEIILALSKLFFYFDIYEARMKRFKNYLIFVPKIKIVVYPLSFLKSSILITIRVPLAFDELQYIKASSKGGRKGGVDPIFPVTTRKLPASFLH